MMRFHTTLEAAEGQHYDALQQGAPQQPRVTLVLCLPSSEDTLAASRRLPPRHALLFWQSLLAPPLCRCQEGPNSSLSPRVSPNAFHRKVSPSFLSPEDGCLPYNKPSFPSPGGHSSSGTASSKSSTGPRKTDGPRQPQQWTVTEHADFLGSTGQGQYSGELCESFGAR